MNGSGQYDVLVIGGGPAGTAAAWHAARGGLRVLLTEMGRPGQDRVCGEYVSQEATPVLERMLARQSPEVLAAAPRMSWLRLAPQYGPARRVPLPRPGLGISRPRLDAALWQAAQSAGAEAMAETRVRAVRAAAAGYEIEMESVRREPARTVHARALVVACGRWWRIAGLSSPADHRHRDGNWAGVKARFIMPERPESKQPAVELYCLPEGYCGLAPVEDGRVNVCCLIRRERLRGTASGGIQSMAAWLNEAAVNHELKARLAGARQVTATVTTAPVRLGEGAARQAEHLLAGDAAGFLDPFTGDGIARALCGGARAGMLLATASQSGERNWPARAAGEYESEWRRSGQPAFRAVMGLRPLLGLPVGLQNAMIYLLARPGLARLCFAATRWRMEHAQG